LIQKSGLHDDLAGYHEVYGKYELATGNYQKAIDHFQQSQQIALGNNLKPIQLRTLLGLSESYEFSGKFREALEYRKIYSALKDSVFKTESSKKLAEFHAKFENNKMLMENEALRWNAEWKRKVFMASGIASGAIVITLLLVILLLRLKTRNASQARQIAEHRTENLELELELRNKELTCNAMAIIKKNEAVTEMVEALEQAAHVEKNPEFIGSLIEKFRNHEKDTNWKEFEMRFTQVHTDFYEKLNERFPDLTPNERKLCAFLRLNMTTKDIASITHQSVHSINVARTRLRRKMNLANSDENLISFLTNL
jgi:tetratricopeptide (TPR) repeat protein